jgi:hypothetical protein
MDEPTDPDERGRLLGIMEPTAEPVMSLDFAHIHRARDLDKQGNHKWPYGLLNSRAWTLLERPRVEQVSKRKFAMDAVSGIVALNDEETDIIEALAKREAKMAVPSAGAQVRIARAGGPRFAAPPPNTTRAGIMHMRRAPASTYLFELAGASKPSFKIGWAFDWKKRLRGFNHTSMPDLGGIHYKGILTQNWHTAMEAFCMEQRLLQEFQSFRHKANGEVLFDVDRDRLKSAWYRFVQFGK